MDVAHCKGLRQAHDSYGVTSSSAALKKDSSLQSANNRPITGAGFTFATLIYSKWGVAYQKSDGAKVIYQGIGSSGGFKQLMANGLPDNETSSTVSLQDKIVEH